MLSLEKIKAAHGPRLVPLEVPEWSDDKDHPESVLVKRLSAQDFIALSAAEKQLVDVFTYMLDVCRRSLVNDDESPLFTDENLYLLTDNPRLVMRLGKAILQINGLDNAEAKKKLETTP